jgi:hypothetical protein
MGCMERFPPGGWELDDYEGFEAWTTSLKLLGFSSRVSAAVGFIYRLRGRFEQLCTVPSSDERSSEPSEDEEPPTAPAFAAGTAALGAFQASGRPSGTIVTEIDGVEVCDNDPRVSYFPFLDQYSAQALLPV